MNESLEKTEMTETVSLNEDQEQQNSEITAKDDTQKKPNKFVAWIKEFFRKFMVGLKRRPQNIAMVIYIVALLVYTLNLTSVSNSTARIQGDNMGLCQFVAVLFSILGFVCMINVYPRRHKPNYVMLAIFFVMMIAVVACDLLYRTQLLKGVPRSYIDEYKLPKDTIVTSYPQEFIDKYTYLFTVQGMLIAHIILIGVASLAFGLAPFIGKLLAKIDTSVNVEYNTEMGTIEREDE